MAADLQHHQQHTQNSGAKFEQCHVQQVYNEIASSVNDIQHRAWPNVKRFLKKLDKGALVADIGCGNGRYLSINNNTYKVGVDICQPLVDNSRSKGHEVAYADNLYLPFRSDMFDAVVSIGVVHHFCSPDRRVRAIRELARIMKPGGKLMLYVWAFEQKHRKFDSQDVLVPWHEGRLKRTDSATSCQSSSGFSSTGSISEDESSEIDPTETLSRGRSSLRNRSLSRESSLSKERTPKSRLGSRQSSVSLEDISTLSNFNSNYYSLDFSPNSPAKNTKLQNHKKSLIKECREIEASLRAMSASCLCEKDKQNNETDIDSQGIIQKCQHSSLENLSNCTKDSAIAVGSPRSRQFSSSQTSKVSSLIFCSKRGSESKDSPLKRNFSLDDMSGKGSFEDRSPIDIYFDDDDEVFLTFDDTTATVSKLTNSESQTGNNELMNDFYDQVNVQFKPDRPDIYKTVKNKLKEKESKENGKSVFGLLKSKVLQMFNRDDNGAKDAGMNESVSTKMLPKTNNHVKQMCMTPELPNDLIHMAAKLNFAVREFPLSSCLDVQNTAESPVTPKSPKIYVKFNIGGDGLENQVLSPKHLKKFNFRQESVEKYVKPHRSVKKLEMGNSFERNGNRKLEKGNSFERNGKSPKLERKISANQIPRVNSGNDLLKSAIRNRTIKQMSPTGEVNRSNPFMVRSFSSDYVEDPSTAYPFKNMNESDSEEINAESPKEVLSIEQTLYDCFMRLDTKKLKREKSTVNNDKRKGSLGSEESVDSIDGFDDLWEYGDAVNSDKINMTGGNLCENRVQTRCQNYVNSKAEFSDIENDIKSGYKDSTRKFESDNKVNDSDSLYNGTVKSTSPVNCDTKWIEMTDDGKRTLKASWKEKGRNIPKQDCPQGICNVDNEINHETEYVRDTMKCDNKGTVYPDEIPDVSCMGKAKEGSVSTKLSRYYHVFREGELEKLISSHVKDLHIMQCFYDHANWCLMAVKVDTDTEC